MTDWFEKVPKTEIHLHLEGAIPHSALWELVQKYGGDPSVKTFDELEARFEYRDFPHFLDIWTWKNGFLREYEDFELIAAAVAQDLVGQNIRYVEAFYSPSDFAHHGLQTQKITEAVRAGLNQVSGIEVALIADLVRDYGPERAMETLKEVNEVTEFGIIGIGLGGAEHDYPPVLFQEAYDTARKSGLRTTAHAGEGAGAESVRSAIDDLRVDRIGHGVRAQEDEQLLERLAASQIEHQNRRCYFPGTAPDTRLPSARHPRDREHRRPEDVWQYLGRGISLAGTGIGIFQGSDPAVVTERDRSELDVSRSKRRIKAKIRERSKLAWLTVFGQPISPVIYDASHCIIFPRRLISRKINKS
jgi:adenosine deaminase